jgi:RimJ/RimL family protein N-acetyltransferase
MRNDLIVEIRPARESDMESARDAVNSVAAEKWYLATVDGFSAEQSRAFIERVVKESLPQVLAIAENKVVGFCDILPNSSIGFTHVGRLGMGVRAEWRRHGIGRRMLEACVILARTKSIEKIELEVFSDNLPAIRLYDSMGFVQEGVKVRGRRFENRYQDVVLMALWL